uniref:Cysteine desulfurase n=1 Tax=uncultured Armatimonadetes bacterium TaxID=157466 RepID=A0A6J4K588_9BACT|nr:Cysteine desulfurase [uncultured Armatimonadetes bacterium]
MTFDELRALFPSAQGCVHLNHAGTSPIAQPVADAVNAVTHDLMSDDPFLAYRNHMKRQETLRAAFGRMMGVPPSTLAFTRNTSHGLAIAADGIPFSAGDNVVVSGTEYPANVYPWMAQGHRGVETRLVPAREGGLVSEEDLVTACDDRTRVLAVSWVQWGTGQRMDLARLGAFCRERGILFVVDLVQGLGALRVDLSALRVDLAAAGCHKWLLAPGGLGVLYVRPGVLPLLRPTNIGWNSVVDSIDWDRIHFDLRPDSQRFEEGTPNLLGTAALHASVSLLEAVGFDAVEERILALAARIRGGLAARGYRVLSPDHPGARSGIVAFRHPTLPNDAVLAALTERRVIAAVRAGNVRFAPHAYNNEADVDAAMAALPS